MELLIDHLLSLAIMMLLLMCSAFFSGTESALFSLSRSQIRRLRHEGHQVERLLNLLTGNPSGLLVAILFGNLVVNILYFAISLVDFANPIQNVFQLKIRVKDWNAVWLIHAG